MIKDFFSYSLCIFFFICPFLIEAQNSPYYFIENKGQWPEKVLYRADLPGGKFFLKNSSFTYLFYDTRAIEQLHEKSHKRLNPSNSFSLPEEETKKEIKMHSFEVEFLNGNLNNSNAEYYRGDYYNYYQGERKGIKARSFGKVIYKSIYPKVDLHLYSKRSSFKYDLIIHPGGKQENIRINYKGVEDLYLKEEKLYLNTSVNTVIEEKPFAYQVINKDTLEVECRYQLTGKILTFDFPKGYNKAFSVIIDPILVFSTFSGSTSDNWGFTATYGENGSMYNCGNVFDPGFPTTTGAFQVNFSDNIDVGILKFDSTGSKLLYATYLGGEGVDTPHSIISTNTHELVILGTTSSKAFPVSNNAYDKSFNGGDTVEIVGLDYFGGSDIFLSKVSSDGSLLLASSYIGGTGNDGLFNTLDSLVWNYGDQFRGDVNIDNEGFIYVASQTKSTDFPAKNSFQQQYGGGESDGVVFKMLPDLTGLEWSGYIGGKSADGTYSIKLDREKNVYLGGGTASNTFPNVSSIDSFKGIIDGYIAVIDRSGSSIHSFRFLGTETYDQAYFIDLDREGNVYALGQSFGLYPIEGDVYSNAFGGQFIHKLNNSLENTIFSTVFGSNSSNSVLPNISPTAFMVSDCETIYFSGWGGETNYWGSTSGMEITSDAFQKTTDGSDFYLMVLSKDAKELIYSTFFGGSGKRGREHVDGGTSRFDKKGIVYQSVCASCRNEKDPVTTPSNFPTSPESWSPTNKNPNNCNMAAFKFDLSILDIDFNLTPSYINCQTLPTIQFKNLSSNGTSFFWEFGDNTTSSEENPTHTYSSSNIYNVKFHVSNSFCTLTKEIELPIIALKVPNVITPNGDNKNDFFVIKSQEPIKLTIINRWGREVYASDEYKNDWAGEGLPAGVYYYSLMDKNNNTCKGWVQILK